VLEVAPEVRGGELRPVDRPRAPQAFLEVGDPARDLLVRPLSEDGELGDLAVVRLGPPSELPGRLPPEALAEALEAPAELGVLLGLGPEELPGPLDPPLREGPDELRPVERVEQVVGPDVVRER
jgi:hypothetical protein